MKPLNECPRAALAAIRGVLTDIDETVSTEGRLTAAAYRRLEALKEAGLLVIPVTGRPAGWCDHVARFWPVDAVVGENGAFWMWHDRSEAASSARASSSPRPSGPKAAAAWRLIRAAGAARGAGRGHRLGPALSRRRPRRRFPRGRAAAARRPTSQRIVAIFERQGAHAKVSSIHVNGWFGDYDKLTTSKLMMRELFGVDLDAHRERYVFAGDSPNDSPMFGYFPNAVGMANVRDFTGRLDHQPRWVTRARSGAGFVELARALIDARR